MREEKELILSEEQARRLWERAAQLQAEASLREEAVEGDPDLGGTGRSEGSGVFQVKRDLVAEKVRKTEAEWNKVLTPEQYRITRLKGTERAFSGEYWNTKEKGLYLCVCCGTALFDSDTKFESSCGWPSFAAPAESELIREEKDLSLSMVRTEVVCHVCDAHLGHVFPDGPPPTGLRYCINSAALRFEPPVAQADEE